MAPLRRRAEGGLSPGGGTPLNVVFLHPDLGLGGAERLIVDAAAELAARGHVVKIVTAHHDPSRCFDETLSGAPLPPSTVTGGCPTVACVSRRGFDADLDLLSSFAPQEALRW